MIVGNWAKAVCVSAILFFAVASPLSADTVVRFQTVAGDFHVQLYDTAAPITVANFLNYVNDGDYVNSFFHRLMPGFVLQGGGFTFDANVGVESPWPTVPTDPPILNEYNVSNTRGTIAMAKLGGDPNSATSQFFFNLGDNSANLDNQNGGFTVFGEVIGNGMDIVDLLASQQAWNASAFHGAFTDLPLISYDPGGSVPWTETLEMFNVVPALPGEVNGDGFVGGDDLSIIMARWGLSGATLDLGDLDSDGFVGGGDYSEVLANWGNGTPPEAIPEPTALALLLVGTLAGLIRRPQFTA